MGAKGTENYAVEHCPQMAIEKPADEMEDQPVDTVEIICSHGKRDIRNFPDAIELVPDFEEKSTRSIDKLIITCTGPNLPTELIVSPHIRRVAGPGVYAVPVYYEHESFPIPPFDLLPFATFLKDLSYYFSTPYQSFTISNFPPGFPNQAIHVYNPDKWEFKLEISDLKVRKRSVEWGWKYKKKYKEISRYRYEPGKNQLVDKDKKPLEFTIKKRGRVYEIELDQIIEAARNLYALLDKFCELMTTFKAGVYFSYEIKKLSEWSIDLKFGYSEHNDHRVYLTSEVNVDVELLNVEFEVGVGVGVSDVFNLQLFAYGELDISVKGSINNGKPLYSGENAAHKAEITGEVTGKVGLGGRANAAFFYSYEVKGTTGVKGSVSISFFGNPSFDMECELEFLGVYYSLETSCGKAEVNGFGRPARKTIYKQPEIAELKLKKDFDPYRADLKDEEASRKVLFPSKRLGSFRLGDKFVPKEQLSASQIHERLSKMLSESNGFFTYSGRIVIVDFNEEESDRAIPDLAGYAIYLGTLGNVVKDFSHFKTVPDSEVAQYLMEKIIAAKALDRSITGIKGLTIAIGNALRQLQGDNPRMLLSDLKFFIERRLDEILEKHCI